VHASCHTTSSEDLHCLKGTADLASDCVVQRQVKSDEGSQEEQQVSWWCHARIQILVTLHIVSLLQSEILVSEHSLVPHPVSELKAWPNRGTSSLRYHLTHQNQTLLCRHQHSMQASAMFLKQKGKVKMTVTPVMAASMPEGRGGAGCGRLPARADRSMVGR